MRILYIGASSTGTTSLHRADCLRRLGHCVEHKDPYIDLYALFKNTYLRYFHFRTGYSLIQRKVETWFKSVKGVDKVDLIWIDSGELFGKDVVQYMRDYGVPVVLFNHDDPTGNRDGNRFLSLKSALPIYNLVTAVRSETEFEIRNVFGGNPFRIWRTYDEVQHSPLGIEQELPNDFVSDVCFIGTWMRHEKRDIFIINLIERGLNLAIWGGRWDKSAHWKKLKQYWRGGHLSGIDYVRAIRGSKVCLGFLSHGNRDLHTTRSMEIPFAGGVLCAERTSEHEQLYKENEEAVFWKDDEECARKCYELLDNSEKREQIRKSGMRRVRENKVGNEDICRQILEAVFS